MDAPRSAFERPIELGLRTSLRLATVLSAVYAGAALSTLLLDGGGWQRWILFAAVSLWGCRAQYRFLRGRCRMIDALRLRSDGVFEICLRAQWTEADLIGADIVEPWLTVLVFRAARGRPCAAVLLPDNTDLQAFRRLRARLRMGAWQRGGAQDGVRGGVS